MLSPSVKTLIAKKCKVGEDFYMDKTALYEEYCRFCIDNGRESSKKHSFMRNIRAQGFKEVRDPKTREYLWCGLKLRGKKDE